MAVNYRSLRQLLERDFRALSNGKAICLLAVTSFEERSTGVALALSRLGANVREMVVFDYDTNADPFAEDKLQRELHRREIKEAFPIGNLKEFGARLNPYSTPALLISTREAIKKSACDFIVIDISCMTRVHLLALATLLATDQVGQAMILMSYTAPESYGFRTTTQPGWRDTLHIPIGGLRTYRREGHARGVVLAGHDGERLSVALGELEPASGCFIYTKTPGRPDFMQRSREENKATSERLLTLRMPRSLPGDNSAERADAWREGVVSLMGFEALALQVEEQVRAAEPDEGPVVLFPFGPKPLSLAASMVLASDERAVPWAVYPIPHRYSIDYSHGIAGTYWMEVITRSAAASLGK